MRLDSGTVTIYRQDNIAEVGDMPRYNWTAVWASYFAERTVGVNRYYTAKAHNDQIDLLVEVQQNRSLSTATDRAAIDRSFFGLPTVEPDNNLYFRITQIQQILNSDNLPVTELSLERIEGLE